MPEDLSEWQSANVRACSFCGRRDWQLLQESPFQSPGQTEEDRSRVEDAAICDRCIAEGFGICTVNLGRDWYRSVTEAEDS
jgi:hypothetical protein